ncbi:MAG: polysaccharide deacetylase family protein [Bacteroidales bacterium]|nr:polysaccharide deacetylase family protein [Bacteroidales bacterium]
MLIVKPPDFITRLMPRMTWGFYGELRKVFLTFDDGPTPEVSDWVLAQLESYNAKATFFCIGRNVEHYPDVYQRILGAGHSVGNHTYSHLKGFRSSKRTYYEDIELASGFINSNLFRPPYGRIRRAQVLDIVKQYRIIMWNTLSIDYNRKVPGDQVYHNVVDNVKPGSIIVFHDSDKARKNLYYALPRVLKFLQDEGYEMEAIPMQKYKADRMWLKGVSGRRIG